jgi:exodeoxyribonuclease V beta subunit
MSAVEATEEIAPAEFDLTGPLPVGLTLLEASAGTGKTFAIAALVTRYVAEGVPLDQLLVVTFTRAATGELRDRVRQRLVAALGALDRHLAGLPPDSDSIHALLSTGSRHVIESRARHLAVALAEFDGATIVTTHAFCDEVLQGLGTAGDVARDVNFLDDAGDLLSEVVDDFYVRKFGRQPWTPEFDHLTATRIAEAATRTPGLDLEPRAARSGTEADLRYRFATNVRTELARRKLVANTLGYDDILQSLADSLDPAAEPRGTAAARLRDRFRVVLVDEFQDTDPTQWQILERAFVPGTTLILVGDPKQAIYSFRGADVHTYLAAAEQADRRTLAINWRSDQGLLDGIDALLDGAALGDPRIRCRPARAATANRRSRLVSAGDPMTVTAPVRVRVLASADRRIVRDFRGAPTVDSVRQAIAQDLAADVVRLLRSDAQLRATPLKGVGRADRDELRPVSPGDIAVLVSTNREAATVRHALEMAGVPAVIHGGGNVFATPVAIGWLQLLEGLERPTSAARARAAALSDFVGWDVAALAAATDAEIGALQGRMHAWAAVLEHQGVGALMQVVTVSTGLPARVLGQPDGERRLTDIHHIAELLHAETVAEHLGTSALAAWLRRRVAEGEGTQAAEERSRRLESDADAVGVLTIHRSKGLEFPVVYLPDLAEHDGNWGLPSYHDPRSGRRTLDVGRKGDDEHPDFQRHWNYFEDEQRGEDLRQAYVALTRAGQQVTLWWGPFKTQALSPLTRLLLADRDEAGTMRPKGGSNEDAVLARLATLSEQVPGCFAFEPAVHEPVTEPWRAAATDPSLELEARRFDRTLDTAWRRTSYSALTAAAHDSPTPEIPVASEAEEGPLSDEVTVAPTMQAATDDPAEPELRATPSLMAGLGKGPAFGVLVHSVLEAVAFDAPDLGVELASAIDSSARFAQPGLDRSDLATALAAVIDTPLGPSVGNLSLRQVGQADRLDELGFELPLGGGDSPDATVTVGDIAELLADRLTPDDPLVAYPDRLGNPALDSLLRGYLNGSIDLLLRLHAGRAAMVDDRFVVVDYKTNWLGPSDEPLTAWHYRPTAMADAMAQAHYPLQALLYSVALHRYLRWRLASYDPERHLGGVLYLFIRGMSGPSTPRVNDQPCGVFAWHPPAGLIVALSDLFDRGRS